MERIASFAVNHDTLTPGMYTSRLDGDVITYDIRMTYPNSGSYLENSQMHTFEHLFATYARNSRHGDKIIYVGPMGCRTGFYFLTRDTLDPADAIALVRDTLDFIAEFDGPVPGATPVECGNAAEHSLPQAKELARRMQPVMETWTVERLEYLK